MTATHDRQLHLWYLYVFFRPRPSHDLRPSHTSRRPRRCSARRAVGAGECAGEIDAVAGIEAGAGRLLKAKRGDAKGRQRHQLARLRHAIAR